MCLLLLAATGLAQAHLEYVSADGALIVVGYTGPGGELTIPDTTNGLPVTAIGDGAFKDHTGLTGVTIGSNVTTIGNDAFSFCFSLTRVTLPAGLTHIGLFAFYGTKLTSLALPESVVSIGAAAFLGCSSLPAITVAAANAAYSSVGGVLFDVNQTTLIQCPGGKAGFYAITNRTTRVGDYAFSGCARLTGVTIPGSVTRLGNDAFDGCTSLTNVTLGTNVAAIGPYAFWNCTQLTGVALPASVTNLGDHAFYGCSSLTAITVNASCPAYASAAGVLFDKSLATLIQCPGGRAGSYTVPAGVTVIGDWAFDGCTRLTAVTLANSLTNLGDHAFSGCTGLTAITVPGSVTRIGDQAFEGCLALGRATLGAGVTTLGERAFAGCTNLATLTIPALVTSIGGMAFYDCTSLASLYFRGDAPTVGLNVFDAPLRATVYYLPDTDGWDETWGGQPAVVWNPQVRRDDDFGVGADGFGFTVTGSSNLVFVVECCTSLEDPTWLTLGTNTLTGGSRRFTDPQWTFYPRRLYRFRSP